MLYDARSYDPIRSDKGLKERMLVEYVCEDWVGLLGASFGPIASDRLFGF